MSYYLKRVGQAIVVFLSTITFTFMIYRLLPFGPIEQMKIQMKSKYLSKGVPLTAARIRQINARIEALTSIRPDAPLYVQYIDYITGIIFHLNFGTSIYYQDPVFQILFTALPWSVFISVYGLALGTTVSLVFGAVMAYREGSRFDKGLTTVTVLTNSVPYYIVAIILLIIFAFHLEWLPAGGKMDPDTVPGLNLPFIIGIVEHATLPVLASFIAGFGGALAYRGNCVREMGKGYIRVARLRGISQGRIALRYVGRNALLPVYTSLLLGVSALFGSSIILETIFNYRAMGFVTYQALLNRDYPLIMGAFIFYTTLTLLGILIADMTYSIIDPRVKAGGDRETY